LKDGSYIYENITKLKLERVTDGRQCSVLLSNSDLVTVSTNRMQNYYYCYYYYYY
jgi:hypothetical protein